MKPHGLTPTLQIVRPTTAQHAIWDAVVEAIAEGMTPEGFLTEVREAWAEEKQNNLRSELDALH